MSGGLPRGGGVARRYWQVSAGQAEQKAGWKLRPLLL